MNKQRGITLIALVITIIVLLILAAVSIATLTEENGILHKSKESVETHNRESIKEELNLLIAWEKTEHYDEQLDRTKLLKYLEEDTEVEIVDLENGMVEFKGYEITIDDQFQIASLEEFKGLRTSLTVKSGTKGQNGWYISDVQLDLKGEMQDSTISEMVYQINGGKEITVKGDYTTIALNDSAKYEITYFAKAEDGTRSNTKKKEIKIDKELPNGTIQASSFKLEAPGSVTIQVQLNNTVSEIDIEKIKYEINNSGEELGKEEEKYSNQGIENLTQLSSDTANTYYIHVLLSNHAGNKEEVISQKIHFYKTTYYLQGSNTYDSITGGYTSAGKIGEYTMNARYDFAYGEEGRWALGNYYLGACRAEVVSVASTVKPVDLTNIDTLYCDWLFWDDRAEKNKYCFGVTKSACSAEWTYQDKEYKEEITTANTQMSSFQTVSLDVSGLTGSYYIKLHCERVYTTGLNSDDATWHTCYLGFKNIYGR